MKNKFRICTLVILIMIAGACKKIDLDITPLQKDKLTGVVQKGPLNNGSTVMISELNNELVQTGKTLTSTIEDANGLYEIDNIEFISQYVLLTASGFYFNEVAGKYSYAQITLSALSDLSDKNSLNINVITSLEKNRVEYLVADGMDFDDAKIQALHEILAIFEIEAEEVTDAEMLEISGDNEGSAVLLAVSAMLQGYRTAAELSLFLANLSTDLKKDGTLDDPDLQGSLIEHAKSLNLPKIRENLEDYYNGLDLDYTIPDFETYITHFIESSDYEPMLINYPENGLYGRNVLNENALNDTLVSGESYSFAAQLPANGSVKIVLKNGSWGYVGSTNINWAISSYDHDNKTQTFTSVQDGEDCDLKVIFDRDTGQTNLVTVEFYEFEAESPTRVRYLAHEDPDSR